MRERKEGISLKEGKAVEVRENVWNLGEGKAVKVREDVWDSGEGKAVEERECVGFRRKERVGIKDEEKVEV